MECAVARVAVEATDQYLSQQKQKIMAIPGAAEFLSQYPEAICARALRLRDVLLTSLPGIIEEVDLPAKIVGYMYGRKYAETVCVIIPSKKGLKLGFYKGNELPDPQGLLEGTGKISRYVVMDSDAMVTSPELKQLIAEALAACKERMALST